MCGFDGSTRGSRETGAIVPERPWMITPLLVDRCEQVRSLKWELKRTHLCVQIREQDDDVSNDMGSNPTDDERKNALVHEAAGEILTVSAKICGEESAQIHAAALMLATSTYLVCSGIDIVPAIDYFKKCLELAKNSVSSRGKQ